MIDLLVQLIILSASESFLIDTIGFHQVTNVTKNDNISVKYDSRSLRLFLFIPFNSNLFVDHLFVDGTEISSQYQYSIESSIGLAVDADQFAEFTFDLKHEPEPIFYSNYISLWLIPRDLCSTSSYFESGGLSISISSNPSEQSIISRSEYTQYSMCAFSPVFDFTKASYSINFGVDSSNSRIVTSKSCIYTKNFDASDFCIDDYKSSSKYKVSNEFFIQYTINATTRSFDDYSSVDDRIKIILKRSTDKSNNTDFFDLFCVAQSVDACNSTNCTHDDDIEDSFDYHCNTKLDHYFRILLIVVCSIVAFTIIIAIMCSCGCCICCGIAGCTCCCCNIHHDKKMNQKLLEDDPESIKTYSQYNNNDYYTQNPATPIVYPMQQQQYITQQYQNPTIVENPPIYST